MLRRFQRVAGTHTPSLVFWPRIGDAGANESLRSRCQLPLLAARFGPVPAGEIQLPLIADLKLVVARMADRPEVSHNIIRQGPYSNIELAHVPEGDAIWGVDRAGIGMARKIIDHRLLFVESVSQHPGIHTQRARRFVCRTRHWFASPKIEARYPRQAHESVAVLPQAGYQPLVVFRFVLRQVNSLRPRHVERRE